MSKCLFFFKVLHMIKGFFPFNANIFLFSLHSTDSRLEGWISLPTKNTKRFGWDKKVTYYSHVYTICLPSNYQDHWVFSAFNPLCLLLPFPLQYVVVSSKKILFYNSELDREQANPFMTLEIEWVLFKAGFDQFNTKYIEHFNSNGMLLVLQVQPK